MSVSDLSVGCRFADYFIICGLDFDSGLEADRLSGDYKTFFVRSSFIVDMDSKYLKACYFTGDNLHVSPLDRSYKGKVLAHYPDNVNSNPFDEHAVCMVSYCYK